MADHNILDKKTCNKCGIKKPVSEFHRKGKSYFYICKQCVREQGYRNPPKPRITPPSKVCPTCKIQKPASEYAPSKLAADGLRTRCKTCIDAQIFSITEKVCPDCGRLLPMTQYGTQNRTTQWGKQKYYQSVCKACMVKRTTERMKETRRKCIEYLGSKCADCGLLDSLLDLYDIHHLDRTKKDFNFNEHASDKFENLIPELNKCVLLCALCHRRRHAQMRTR